MPHHPAINEVIAAVSSELACLGELSAYDEATHSGTLRYLQLSVERSTRLVQLVLVANARRLDEDAALGKLAARLWSRHGEAASPRSLHSIWVNLNHASTNNILSYEAGSWQLLHHAAGTGEAAVAAAEVEDEEERAVVQLPPGCLIERYASVAHDFVLPPFVFRQANLEGFDGVVRALCAAQPASGYAMRVALTWRSSTLPAKASILWCSQRCVTRRTARHARQLRRSSTSRAALRRSRGSWMRSSPRVGACGGGRRARTCSSRTPTTSRRW